MNRLAPYSETWVMRGQGSAFSPETTCEYTGLTLWQFPLVNGSGVDSWRIGYFRADGHLRAVRQMTYQERAWILENPAQYAAQRDRFAAWLESTRKSR